jgi:FAD/FMN-containing dehydrogenase
MSENAASAEAEWVNWSGSLRFTPRSLAKPRSEAALGHLVRRAAAEGRKLRAVAAGHSSSPPVETDDMQGVLAVDKPKRQADIAAGTSLKAAGEQLHREGLAFHNLGDVDVQTVVGAIATGTHGSGRHLRNLATMLAGGRMMSASGEIIEIEEAALPAARCSLGALGIFSVVRVQLLDAYRLERYEYCARIEDCLAHLDELFEENRNFDFYWYPRSDEAKLRMLNPPGQGSRALAFAHCVSREEGWSHELIARRRQLKFEEMEYALPAEAGVACFRAIHERMKTHHRRDVAWRVLYRHVAADDAFLSPAHGRETVTISLHHNAGLPYAAFFDDIEPVFRAHDGRPHWGKKHSLGAAQLRELYPRWDDFLAWRKRFDPAGLFMSPALQHLLEDGAQ